MKLRKNDSEKSIWTIMKILTVLLFKLSIVTLMVIYEWDAILTLELLLSKITSSTNSLVRNTNEMARNSDKNEWLNLQIVVLGLPEARFGYDR